MGNRDSRALAVWLLRLLWFLLPLTLGQAVGDAISSAHNGVPRVMTIGLWILWAAAMVASMVPLPVTLTAVRIIAPGTLPLAIWAALDLSFSALSVVACIHAIAVTVAALNQLIGDRFVDGASYGDERRMLLRPPAMIGLVLVPLLWLAIAAGTAAGPLLLADRRWILGGLLTVAALPVIAIAARAVHQLVQRWIVFVPTGMVLHDMQVLTEPVLFRRTAIERLGAAIEGTPARDLSNKAAGLLLECELADPAPLGLRDPATDMAPTATMTDVRRFLFCPTRPGALLDEAERRNIAVD